MKILLAGNWEWEQYEEACADSLRELGHEVMAFTFNAFFIGKLGRLQNAFAVLPGPAAIALNHSLLKTVCAFKPEVLLVWRGTHVWPRTLRKIRSLGCRLISYNNDDPFGPFVHRRAPWHHRQLWTWYIEGLKEYEVNFVYRPVNVPEAISAGAHNVHVLMPYFIPALHHPVKLSEAERERYGCDIVFVGHYEPDGREHYLRALVQASLHVRLFAGAYWTKKVLGELADYFDQVRPVLGMEYAKALCGARMCLAFLSKMNRDAYTRRCFEIPACGQLLLCERTPELKRMFREDEEIVFFSSPEELVHKAQWLKSHPEDVARIARAGMNRVLVDGHDVSNRMRQMLEKVTESAMSH